MLKNFKLERGRSLLLQEVKQDHETNDWIVFFPGSSAELWNLGWSEQRSLTQASKANLLVINKPGVNLKGKIDQQKFEASFRRSTRVKDYLDVLKGNIPRDASIYLVGYSEGAYLAPEVALNDPRIRGLVLICGGTRSWLDEEIYKPSALDLNPVIKRIASVYKNPLARNLFWHGNSYATWTSYDNDNTYHALKKLNIPILAIHASKDTMIDLDSAQSDLRFLKIQKQKPITMRLFKDVDHTLGRHWQKALRSAGSFIALRLQTSSDQVDPSQSRQGQRPTAWR